MGVRGPTMGWGRLDPGLGCRVGRAIQGAERLCFLGLGLGCLRVGLLGHPVPPTHTYRETHTDACKHMQTHTYTHT